MTKLKLTFACQAYDWTKPIMERTLAPDGIEIAPEVSAPVNTFERLLKKQEFDVAELGLTFYLATLESNPHYVAIPIFPVRLFRLSSIYVSAKSPIRDPGDLAGKRFGEVFTFGHDAGIWARGVLRDYYDVSFSCHTSYSVGGVGHPTPKWDWVRRKWPLEARARHIGTERTLDQMLESDEIDVLFSVMEPPGLHSRPPSVRRLFSNVEFAEREYFRKSGVFPIMHTVVIRREIYDKNPWIARSLYDALVEAKRRVMEREHKVEYVPFTHMLPLYSEHKREIRELMGDDYWPYGFAPNRRTLDVFLGYHHDLGISSRRFQPEELFLSESLTW